MKEFTRALLLLVTLTILTGLVYPFAMTGIVQLCFPHRANGSLVVADGKVVGSALIGQDFSSPKYFNGRPSALEKAYDASNSGGSNSGPSSAKFLEEVGKRIGKVRKENGLEPTAPVPADLVLASGSGLDPHISLDAALIQVPRIARARGLSEPQVRTLVEKLVEPPFLGLAGQNRVNVLELNLALDGLVSAGR
jgi:K+-transporting ATPase ATPase C chain